MFFDDAELVFVCVCVCVCVRFGCVCVTVIDDYAVQLSDTVGAAVRILHLHIYTDCDLLTAAIEKEREGGGGGRRREEREEVGGIWPRTDILIGLGLSTF